jgi:SAM-dependent methyltransferase
MRIYSELTRSTTNLRFYKKKYVEGEWSPFARLSFESGKIFALGPNLKFELPFYLCSMLEVFAFSHSVKAAYARYQELATFDKSHFYELASKARLQEDHQSLIIAGNQVVACANGEIERAYQNANATHLLYLRGASFLVKARHRRHLKRMPFLTDLTDLSSDTSAVSMLLALSNDAVPSTPLEMTFDRFQKNVQILVKHNLLRPPIGQVAFGDFVRNAPFCPNYGFSRGTPIDRFFLDCFITKIRDEVVGDVLEIGGVQENRVRYRLQHASSYRTMDIELFPGVDFAGDAHDPAASPASSFDCILLFNVLEHCKEPSIVVENVHRWLRAGGKAFCLVPNAQRVHRDPRDYWRIMPDALEYLFRNFASAEVFTYGNLITTIAALSGLGAEELSSEDLVEVNSMYPVVSCVTAHKTHGSET